MVFLSRLSRLTLSAVLAASALQAQTLETQPSSSPASTPGIIWADGLRPTTPGWVTLIPGEETTLPVAHYLQGEDPSVVSVAVSPQEAVLATILPGGYVELKSTKLAQGVYTVTATLGTGATVSFPVQINQLPVVSFSYTPPAGKTVNTVAVAGDFNGWNQSSLLLTKDAEGVFRGETALRPGLYPYKLVVDGDWVADPTNPNQDTTGYGNSLLRVEGEAEKTFTLQYLSPVLYDLRGFNSGGRLIPAGLTEDEAIDPASVKVFYGASAIPANASADSPLSWSVPESGEEIQLSLQNTTPTRPGDWVLVYAKTHSGKAATAQFPLYRDGIARLPEDELIYFTLTDRFLNGNKENDPQMDVSKVAPAAQYKGGDWAGIKQKIAEGYFEQLGVTTIWLSPVTENVMTPQQETPEPRNWYTSYHGYWPTASDRTNGAFGTMEELQQLTQLGRDQGIAMIQDFVANHVHVNHPWFQEHPEWQTTYELPDGRKNLRLWNEHPFTTWFDTFIPSLDYEKYPEITQRQVEIANFWMDNAGIAGFRHDAVKHIPTSFWKSVTRELRKRPGYELQIGETISDRLTIANFVGPDQLSGQFDFPLYFTLRGILGQGGGKMEDLAKSTLDSYTFYEPYSVMSPLLGNHDVSRFMAYADGDIPQGANEGELGLKGTLQVDDAANYRKLQLGFAYVFAVPGPPTLYYGDEIGMTGASDPDNRRPMVWENWTPEQTALQAAVGRLGRMRQANPALRRGELQVLSAGEEHIVLLRQTTDQAVIAAFFRKGSSEPVSVDLPKGFANIRIESTPLETHGITAQFGAAGGKATLNISGSDYSYGFWSVERAVR